MSRMRIRTVALLSVLSIAGSAYAQPVQVTKEVVKPNGRVKERTRVYNGINQTPWYTNPTVRQQLNLNDAQYNQLNTAYNTAWTRYDQSLNQLDNNLTDAQRAERMNELNNGFYNNWHQSTGTVFNDPAAQQRFNQLHWQYQQYGAFNNPAVRKQLNLTNEQAQKFQTYDQDWNNHMAKWSQDYPNNQEAVNNEYNQYQRNYQNNVNSVLTPAQQQQWNTMIGKPYTFTPNVYFQTTPVTTSKPVIE